MLTTHTSKIVKDTQEQLYQAQAHTYKAVWPPSSLKWLIHCILNVRRQRKATSATNLRVLLHNMRVGTGQVLHMPGQSYHKAYHACC